MSTIYQKTLTIPENLATGHITYGISGEDGTKCGATGTIYFSRTGNTLSAYLYRQYGGPEGYERYDAKAGGWVYFHCVGCNDTTYKLTIGSQNTSSLGISAYVAGNTEFYRQNIGNYVFDTGHGTGLNCYMSNRDATSTTISVSAPAIGDYQITVKLVTDQGSNTYTTSGFGSLVTDTTREVIPPVYINDNGTIKPCTVYINDNGTIKQCAVYLNDGGTIKQIGG